MLDVEGFKSLMGSLTNEFKTTIEGLQKAKEVQVQVNEIEIDFGIGKPVIKKNDIESISTKKKYGFFGSEMVVISTTHGNVFIEDMTIEEVKKKVYKA